jgi:hypothetical protein
MVVKLSLALALLLLMMGCKPKSLKESTSLIKMDSTSINEPANTKEEDFKQFFVRFENDSIFQKQRIDNPLLVVISDENIEENTTQEVGYVSFHEKDWDARINIKKEIISKDTINVILEGTDTGVHIEHLFARRYNKWYLFKIKNLSD